MAEVLPVYLIHPMHVVVGYLLPPMVVWVMMVWVVMVGWAVIVG